MTDIDLEHPEYAARKAMWRKYRDLYAGGEQMRAHAAEYLVSRHKEPLEIYGERLNRVFYQNYVGSIIDWYAATLFRREPAIRYEGPNESGRKFFDAFTENCDRKGTSVSELFRRQVVDMLVCGSSYLLVDFPRARGAAQNRAEEEATGASRAYLVPYRAEELINWSADEQGNYEWIVLRTSNLANRRPADGTFAKETRWFYYDKTSFRTYRQVGDKDKAEAELVDEGLHGLAALGRVPLFEMTVTEGLWLMNKSALLQLEHFNKSNALGWALTMGLFAMPVVYSARDFKQVVGESYYIQLGPDDKFGWTEPTGHVYQIAADNLVSLKEEIYRVCYLMTQAGAPFGFGAGQSALSKQRDYMIAQEVLRAYGDAVKGAIKQILRAIEAARQDGLTIDVSGLDEFDIGDFSSELADAKSLLSLNPGSETLKKEIFKKLTFKYLCDMRQELKAQIAGEIDAAAGEQ
jgi:hypothetical protein